MISRMLKQSCFVLLVGIVLGDINSNAWSHPGHSHRKKPVTDTSPSPQSAQRAVTTDSHGSQGSFVMARDGIVQFRRDDDSLLTVPMDSLNEADRQFVETKLRQIRKAVAAPILLAQADRGGKGTAAKRNQAPLIATHFDTFVKLKAIQTRWDDRYFYVESNGIPTHQMMVGITSWQQQVPLPQKYVGDNAWQIPLHPVPAKTPASAKERFLRGAIAVAVNGIPIFNPLNNRGDDAYLFGELDEFGGHCGRADDYHYHIAPVHLQETVGNDQPIAYALDGYPIYGYQDENTTDFAPLDVLNGHKDSKGFYHYHATKTYPYLNGGFYGEVVERDGQVDPQPRAEPLRPALPPLRDAKITDLKQTRPGSHLLTYEIKGKSGTVAYTLNENGSATFEFTDPRGTKAIENYTPRRRGPADRGPGNGRRPPPRSDNPPPNRPRPVQPGERPKLRADPTNRPETSLPKLAINSSSVDANGMLLIDCTCDGKGQSPAVAWKDAPEATQAFAISLWHVAPDQEKSYWVIYNIPFNTTQLKQNAKPEGTLGLNDRRKASFDPMCSKGPGLKKYHLTVYALSQKIDLAPERATRANLLEAIKHITLAEGTLNFNYERNGE